MRERFCTTRTNNKINQQNCFWINKNQSKMLTTKVDFGWVIFRNIGFISFLIHITPKSIIFKRFSSPSFLRIAFAVREFRQNACKINKIQKKNNCFELQALHQTKRRHALWKCFVRLGGRGSKSALGGQLGARADFVYEILWGKPYLSMSETQGAKMSAATDKIYGWTMRIAGWPAYEPQCTMI